MHLNLILIRINQYLNFREFVSPASWWMDLPHRCHVYEPIRNDVSECDRRFLQMDCSAVQMIIIFDILIHDSFLDMFGHKQEIEYYYLQITIHVLRYALNQCYLQ